MKIKVSLLKIWWALMILTISSVLIAETSSLTVFTGLVICIVVSIKSMLVIDYFMGLKFSHNLLRNVLRSYFVIIPSLVAVGILFPEIVVSMTSLRH